ncbi:MAG TPA: thiamine pyrophosphate-dependent enzyme [Saprospiraceae bacterium]|nr:thiamine pyrophosphate-dependent enzyme [Saprospiraceae bacterium]
MNRDALLLEAGPETGIAGDTMEARILKDYWISLVSREVSILGRKDVLSGKGKFGIFGDGKEIPQVALSHYIQPGDFRSGYYRDQTIMFSLGLCSVYEFFGQMYSDSDNDPFSGGRQMNNHFATPLIGEDGNWTAHRDKYNVISDVSCVAGQVGRALGLAQASCIYKSRADLDGTPFSNKGTEIVFCTIGDGGTAEGPFWETMNAAAIMQVPLVMIVWDDGYGISVPVHLQTVKASISKALEGFLGESQGEGIQIFTVKGWDYPELCKVFEKATQISRLYSTPVLVHVQEMTQPQGHSTSGSHERYKSKDRLDWEKKFDGISVMRSWLLDAGLLSLQEDEALKIKAKEFVKKERDRALAHAFDHTRKELELVVDLLAEVAASRPYHAGRVQHHIDELRTLREPVSSDLARSIRQLLIATPDQEKDPVWTKLKNWLNEVYQKAHLRFHTHQTSETRNAAIRVKPIPPVYSDHAPTLSGYKLLNLYFDKLFESNPRVIAFGEDVGKIGDVNQGFAGLQMKYGEERIFDTGIREWTIVGQAIGMAMRGLRPIAEIQYLDYLIYALSPLSDDLACLRYRSNGVQCAPLIIRTRGHRLEGIWHSGSPMGMMLNSLRGIHILVPRNMVQAAGFYQTMMQSDDPAIIIESLNGYRLKERVPDNLGTYCLPLGVPEVLLEGEDLTLVTYGSCVRVAEQAIHMVKPHGINVELIDIRTLLPFDLDHLIAQSVKKTNKIIFLDEDVPGGATAFMMREVLDTQGAYAYLDAAPVCLSAAAHRPPYGSDGDYFSKPNAEDVAETILRLAKS